MFIRVRHMLRYTYERSVFFEPTTIRLTPRQDATQRLLEHRIVVTPQPSGRTATVEQDGADAQVVWFSDTHDHFRIDCESLIETLRENPYDALITHDPARTLPCVYPEQFARALAPWLSPSGGKVGAWAGSIAEACGHDTFSFLGRLNETIHRDVRIVMREEGAPYDPDRTLSEGSGACRDVAMLFVEACRSLGIAARFVSGYSLHHPPEVTEHEMHAWAEVYLPGAGWRGYDPSLGLAVADGHAALATGPDHRLAAPVAGSYRGTGVRSRMEYEIDLRAADTIDALNTPGQSPEAS